MVLLQKVVYARKVVLRMRISLSILIFNIKRETIKELVCQRHKDCFKPEVRPEKRFQNQGLCLPLNHLLFLSDL